MCTTGLKVNDSKTELCVFHRKERHIVQVRVGADSVQSINQMNVLGVIFDNKLNWSAQVLNSIQKANKALHAICLIKQNFSKNELRMLITSNFYSILFYNSEIWHIPTLQRHLKAKLKSTSANALKICTPWI